MRNSLDPSSWRGSADLNVHGQRLDDTSYIDWVVSAWSGLFYWVIGSQCHCWYLSSGHDKRGCLHKRFREQKGSVPSQFSEFTEAYDRSLPFAPYEWWRLPCINQLVEGYDDTPKKYSLETRLSAWAWLSALRVEEVLSTTAFFERICVSLRVDNLQRRSCKKSISIKHPLETAWAPGVSNV